ncbi:hypothetical protein RchiOBHm_Chr2g0161781 [Rosa chinensis]|uniref:Uncharacterized protein n=1 Tax=Rosa chinensis TaxID=74649 RepID=A0A2P6S2X8_ROSCH|nr:uncharacterized protein LOC112185061 [Rosa chinensis]PRQ53011.1 hypothetical protein RchiOBHm_Chr2g0161781 [Rosa chinensis]
MSVLEYPDAINAPELQVWNNAAFDDNEGSEFSCATVKASWSSESDCSKENLSPVPKTPVFAASSVPFKPLNGNSRRLSVAPKKMGFEVEEEKGRDLGKIDSEIEEIEKEIGRLNSRLELLKLEKAQKAAEKRGRVVAAKFMEPPKQSVKNSDGLRKIEESLNLSARPKVNRRGMSLGPSEIIAGAGFRRPSKFEITPVQKIQDRRKSCFWKLQDIDELRVTKERGKSTSLSPKSRKTASKIGAPKQAATSIGGSKRPVKKEDKVLGSIEPKKLFKEGEKSVPNKKPVKAGRVVASRYNQIGTSSAAAADGRKRSLPDDDKDDGSRCEKKRVSLVGKPRGIGREGSRSVGPESRMKKRWEIPSEVVVFQGVEEDGVAEIGAVNDGLPKIRTVRCVNDTPRGSGPAKRVAELVGMKKYFSNSDEFCQELSFAEEEDGEEE